MFDRDLLASRIVVYGTLALVAMGLGALIWYCIA